MIDEEANGAENGLAKLAGFAYERGSSLTYYVRTDCLGAGDFRRVSLGSQYE